MIKSVIPTSFLAFLSVMKMADIRVFRLIKRRMGNVNEKDCTARFTKWGPGNFEDLIIDVEKTVHLLTRKCAIHNYIH